MRKQFVTSFKDELNQIQVENCLENIISSLGQKLRDRQDGRINE